MALPHTTRLGLFVSSWNVYCTTCRGVLDTSANPKGVRQDPYACAFGAMDREPVLDEL